jgi:16S rRNA processing protein RimM
MNNKKYIEIAKFTKPQGLRGGIRALLYCDSPDVFAELSESIGHFLLGESKTPVKVWLSEVRKGFVVLTVEDIDNAVAAENLVGEYLFIKRADYELPPDTWFIADLIGLDVTDADTGELYGKVEEILQTAPKDVYVIKTPDYKTLMFPSIPEVLIDVNITEGVIKIRPLEGLFEE